MKRLIPLLASMTLTGFSLYAQEPVEEEENIFDGTLFDESQLEGLQLEEIRKQLEEFLQAQGDEEGDAEEAVDEAQNFAQAPQRIPFRQFNPFQGGMPDAQTGVQPLDSGMLKVDNESSAWLERADQYAQQGRYDLASVLWQKVIDESSDLVFTRDEWIETTLENEYQRYQGVASVIETSLSKLPEEGLDAYRLSSDAEALLLIKELEGNDRETALAEVVRRYFLSSRGDDAAFELACRKLERREFLPAIRLFRKILDEYPAPSIPREQIEIRLAAALAWVGEAEQARVMIQDLKARPAVALTRNALEQVEKATERAAEDSNEMGPSSSEGVAMRMGGPSRTGVMPELEHGDRVEGFALAWEQGFDLTFPDSWPTIPQSSRAPFPEPTSFPNRRVVGGIGVQQPAPDEAPTLEGDELFLANWRENRWRPVGEILVYNGRLYFKTEDRVVSCNADTGELEWLGFRNEFPMDEITLSMASRLGRTNATNIGSPEETLLFRDAVHQSMTINNDVLYVLQGKPLDFSESEEVEPPQPENVQFQRNFLPPEANRTRDNRLVAYHAITGKLLWYRKAADEGGNEGFSFAGAAVPYGSLLLIPVHEEATLWLYALDAKTGETMWRSFLCDEPAGQCLPTSPVTIAVDAGEAYVASGAGYIFSLDAISGSLNWALNHPRTPLTLAQMTEEVRARASYGTSRSHLLDGWAHEMLIPHGNALVITTSDYRQIFAIDRRTGQLLWESSKTPSRGQPTSEYVLGVANDHVFVAGSEVIRAYQLTGGKLIWETPVDTSYGRGVLTPTSIYFPTEQSVIEIELKGGRIVGEYGVDTAENEPVGNLFTDGKRFYASGLRRVYALEPILQPKTSEQEADATP